MARRTVAGGLTAVVAGAVLMGVATSRASSDVVTGEDLPVTAMDQRFGPANNSPNLVSDPTDRRFVVLANRLDAPDFDCALHLSGDGGNGWRSVRPVQSLPEGAEKCYAPEVAFDRSGRLYYLFVGLQGLGNRPMGAYLTTSDDRGRTFSAPRQVLGPHNFSVRMGIDPGFGRHGRIHLVWLHANADPPRGGFPTGVNPILAAHSDDGGTTFSDPVQVSDPERARVVAPVLAVGPGHAVHVGYVDLGGDARDYQGLEGPVWEGTWSVVLAGSQDGGAHFGPTTVIDEGIVPSERVMLIFTMPPPSLVVGERLVCAAWTDARYGDPDALARCSTDGGRRWSDVRRLNDDPVDNGRRQYLPRLALSPRGRLDAVFLDRRADPLNARNSVSYTYSTDGGRHFAPAVQISQERSPAAIGQSYGHAAAAGQYEFGARLGLLSGERSVIAAWPDTRNSSTPTGQDIFVTTVRPPRGPGALGTLGAAVTVTGLAAVAATAALWWRARRREPAEGSVAPHLATT